jgi:hypothetical protein
MATGATPGPVDTALVAISSILEVANPEAPGRTAVERLTDQGLARLKQLFDAQTSIETERQSLQRQLAKNCNASVKTFFDIGDCLIDINASLSKHPGVFGSTSWDYFTGRMKDTFGLDAGTASKYMSIARNETLRRLLGDDAYNGEGFTTLYELSRIGSQDRFAEIKGQKYLTPGGERLPHSKAEAFRKEYDESKKSAEQKTIEKSKRDAKERAALEAVDRERAQREARLQGRPGSTDPEIIVTVQPPIFVGVRERGLADDDGGIELPR